MWCVVCLFWSLAYDTSLLPPSRRSSLVASCFFVGLSFVSSSFFLSSSCSLALLRACDCRQLVDRHRIPIRLVGKLCIFNLYQFEVSQASEVGIRNHSTNNKNLKNLRWITKVAKATEQLICTEESSTTVPQRWTIIISPSSWPKTLSETTKIATPTASNHELDSYPYLE